MIPAALREEGARERATDADALLAGLRADGRTQQLAIERLHALLVRAARWIDVLAERLNTTRGALYRTLHDARQNLREQLEKES